MVAVLPPRVPVAAVTVLALAPVVALACAGAPPPPPAPVEAPPASAFASASAAPAPVAPEPPAAPAASPEPGPAATPAVCPQGQVLGSDGNCKAPAPCIDGQDMMGACICPHGKSADETGHCVFTPCPPGATGGTVFRNETTGDCMECRPGTAPCGDHCCPGGGRRGR